MTEPVLYTDAKGRVIDDDYARSVLQTYGVFELKNRPPVGLQDPENPDIVDKKYVFERHLLELVVLIANLTTDLPMYCWQIIAEQYNPDMLNVPCDPQNASAMARRNQLLTINQIIHNLLWTWVMSRQKRLVTMSFDTVTGQALKASFYDFHGCWSQDLKLWNDFVNSYRSNLADIFMEDTFCKVTGTRFPVCHNLLCRFPSTADSQAFRKEHSKVPCLEAWLRKWFRSWNNIKSMSPFPEIQVKAEYFRRIKKTSERSTPQGWVWLYARAFPESTPRVEFLNDIRTADLPPQYQGISRSETPDDSVDTEDSDDSELDTHRVA